MFKINDFKCKMASFHVIFSNLRNSNLINKSCKFFTSAQNMLLSGYLKHHLSKLKMSIPFFFLDNFIVHVKTLNKWEEQDTHIKSNNNNMYVCVRRSFEKVQKTAILSFHTSLRFFCCLPRQPVISPHFIFHTINKAF